MNLNEYCINTHNYLKNNTTYQINKETISACFNTFSENKEVIRLVIIDSMYSTNLNRRLFGFEDISQKLRNIGSDQEIIAESNDYLLNLDNTSKIGALLSEKIGINKAGKPEKKATSLITKYLYYLTKYNFPIYDSLVNDNIDVFIRCFCSKKLTSGSLFEKIQYIKNEFNISYDLLDNGIWFFGKLQKGSLSLLMQKEKYLEFIKCISMPDSLTQSTAIDSYIYDVLIKNQVDSNLIRILGQELFKLLVEVRRIREFV